MGTRYIICHWAINRSDPQNLLSVTLDVPLQFSSTQSTLCSSVTTPMLVAHILGQLAGQFALSAVPPLKCDAWLPAAHLSRIAGQCLPPVAICPISSASSHPMLLTACYHTALGFLWEHLPTPGLCLCTPLMPAIWLPIEQSDDNAQEGVL